MPAKYSGWRSHYNNVGCMARLKTSFELNPVTGVNKGHFLTFSFLPCRHTSGHLGCLYISIKRKKRTVKFTDRIYKSVKTHFTLLLFQLPLYKCYSPGICTYISGFPPYLENLEFCHFLFQA